MCPLFNANANGVPIAQTFGVSRPDVLNNRQTPAFGRPAPAHTGQGVALGHGHVQHLVNGVQVPIFDCGQKRVGHGLVRALVVIKAQTGQHLVEFGQASHHPVLAHHLNARQLDQLVPRQTRAVPAQRGI